MSKPLIFPFTYRAGQAFVRALGMCPSFGLQVESILEPAISRFLRRERLPEKIFVFGCEPDREKLRTVFRAKNVSERLSGLSSGADLIPVLYDPSSSKLTQRENGDWGPASSTLETSSLRQGSMQALFRDLDGMLYGSTSHHYVKPSEKHSDRFIRTANVLQEADAVHLIGMWLAEHIPDQTTFVYCDTSSIATVAYRALLHRFGDAALRVTVDSFRSYEGLKSYEFRDTKNSLAVISASTSGDLAKELVRRGFSPERIVTLYYLGNERPTTPTLCDLTSSDVENPTGFEPIASHHAASCPHCKHNSLATMIVGDQFLTEKPKISSHVLTARDAPGWLRGFMNEFRHANIFAIHRYDPAAQRPVVISVDLAEVVGSGSPASYKRDFDRAVEKTIPVATKFVIHHSTPGAVTIAKSIAAHVKKHTGSDPVLIDFVDLVDRLDSMGPGASVVVTDYVAESRELMNINRVLRKRSSDNAVVYFVGMAGHESPAAYSEMRTSLTFGDGQANKFGFDCVRSCQLPRPHERSAWEVELDLINEIEAWCEEREESLPDYFALRRSSMSASTSTGLTDTAFLPTLKDNSALKLRKDFAYFDSNASPEKISQATVFVTMTAILHGLRQPRLGASVLHNEYYRRSLLSPNNFDRFNDGVIQASLLRAASPAELCYSQDATLSRAMADIIQNVLTAWNTDQGEACAEFLLALCTGRLQLCRDDLLRIAECATGISDPYNVCRVLGEFLRTRTN